MWPDLQALLINDEIGKRLVIKTCYSKQNREELDNVIQSVRTRAMFSNVCLTFNPDNEKIQDTREVSQWLANSRRIEVAIEIYVRLGEEKGESKDRG